jgi:hypothetical protein
MNIQYAYSNFSKATEPADGTHCRQTFAQNMVFVTLWTENFQFNVQFLILQARDNDQADTLNSQVFYQLPSFGQSGLPFTINSQSGEISTLSPLNYETRSQYVFIVEAVDSPIDRRTGTATVTVNVNDLQDQVPLFVETSVTETVNENVPIGTAVALLTVRS